MSKKTNLKRLTRERMERTGEGYVTARNAILRELAADPIDDQDRTGNPIDAVEQHRRIT